MYRNPRGFIRFSSEKKLHHALADALPPLQRFQAEYEFAPGCVVDFFGFYEGKPVLVEVKNWFVRIRDMQQLMKYYVHAVEKYGFDGFRLIVIAGGIEAPRRRILELLGIEVVLTREIFGR